MTAPSKVQYLSALANTCKVITEDPTIKGVFASSGAWMQASDASTQRYMDTITIDIPTSQVAMLAKRGSTLVDQG